LIKTSEKSLSNPTGVFAPTMQTVKFQDLGRKWKAVAGFQGPAPELDTKGV